MMDFFLPKSDMLIFLKTCWPMHQAIFLPVFETLSYSKFHLEMSPKKSALNKSEANQFQNKLKFYFTQDLLQFKLVC